MIGVLSPGFALGAVGVGEEVVEACARPLGFCVKIISAVTHYYFVCCLSTPYLDRGV